MPNLETKASVINTFIKPNSRIYEIQSNVPIKEFSLKMKWNIEVAIETPESYMNIGYLYNIHLTIEDLKNRFENLILE